MKRRGISLILALVVLLSLAACGGKQTPAEDEGMPDEEISGVESEVDGTIDEPQEAPVGGEVSETQNADGTTVQDQPEDLPADLSKEPAGGNLPADPAQKPQDQPVQKPVENVPADSQSKPAPQADLAAFYETLSTDPDLPAMMQAEGEVLDSFYPGLSDVAANQCLVYTAMISASVGEIALVEVRNADDVQRVKDIFQARIDYQVGDGTNPGGAWYPQTIEGWKNGSRIVSNGNYVMMAATYEKTDDIVAAFNALFA